MLKKAASFKTLGAHQLVPVRECEASYSLPREPRLARRLNVPRPKTRPAHHLAGAHKRGVAYPWRRAPRWGLGREGARLGAPGAGGWNI